MTQRLFAEWLHALDSRLSKPSLLLFDSCKSHNISEKKDPLTGNPWIHLRLERLPPNSTSVTQPLDAGVISVFKRRYVDMLINKSRVKKYATQQKVSNGEAWSLIPYAWSQVRASTLRNCFRVTKVLPKAMSDKLEEISVGVRERQSMYPPVADMEKEQMKRHFVRIIASTLGGQEIKFAYDKDQRDENDIAEEIREAVWKELATRESLFKRSPFEKEGSSSVDSEDLDSFQNTFQDQSLAKEVEEWLTSSNPKDREVARYVIRKSKQNKIY